MRRWKRLSEDKTRTSIANLFVMWIAIITAASLIPEIPQFWRYVIYGTDTLFFISVGIVDWLRKKHLLSLKNVASLLNRELSPKVSKVAFWSTLSLIVLDSIGCFLKAVQSWEVFSVDGVAIVTYNNLVSFGFSFVAAIMVLYTFYRIKNRKKIITQNK